MEVKPYESIGILNFSMSIKEVKEIEGEPVSIIIEKDCSMYEYTDFSIEFCNEKIIRFIIAPPSLPYYKNIKLFEITLENIFAIFKGSKFYFDGESVIVEKIGLSFYFEELSSMNNKNLLTSSIFVLDESYLNEDFYTIVDEVFVFEDVLSFL